MIHPSFQKFIHKSASKRNDDLEKISYWAYQSKMQINPDPNKQDNEVIFFRKTSSNNLSHPPIKFNNNDIKMSPSKALRNCFRFRTQLQCSCRS